MTVMFGTNLLQRVIESIQHAGSDNLAMFGGTYEGGYHIQQCPDELARLICFCASQGPFESSLEIGIAAGGTTRMIRELIEIRQTATIDDGQHPKYHIWRNENRRVLTDLSEFIGDSHSSEARQFLKDLNRKFDLVGIDADHSEQGVQSDWELVQPYLCSGAIVWFHDIHACSGVKTLWQELKAVYPVLLETDKLGLGAIRYYPISAPSAASLDAIGPKETIAHIHQLWCERSVPLTDVSEPLFRRPIQFGAVIGTYSAVPYVHLQLEAWRRLYPKVKLLVHDDASTNSPKIQRLCEDYDCDFEVNSQRLPHHLGDLSVFYGGLKWAQSRHIDLLLKISRRWLFTTDWTRSLAELAVESQYATFSNYTSTFNFGFRTECTGMAVKYWATPYVLHSLAARIRENKHVFVEYFIHQFAREFEKANCSIAEMWRTRHPVPPEYAGYAAWDLMGCDRGSAEPEGSHLWHDVHTPYDYARQAKEWGLPYSERDFADPNQGGGLGQANT